MQKSVRAKAPYLPTSASCKHLTLPAPCLKETDQDAKAEEPKAKPAKDIGKKDVEGVFVVGTDNKVTFRPVKVGIAGEKHFEILDGLKEGDKIVAGTYQAIRDLKDGALVRDQKQEAKKPTPGTKS